MTLDEKIELRVTAEEKKQIRQAGLSMRALIRIAAMQLAGGRVVLH